MNKFATIFGTLVLGTLFAASAVAQSDGFTKLGGEQFDFASQRGKVVVIAIGVRWLPLTKNQAAAINKLAAKYDPAKVAFYFVMIDTVTGPPQDNSTDAQLEEFAMSNKLAATVLRDPKGASSSRLFKPDQIPAFVVLDKEGKMVGEAVTGLNPKTDNAALVAARIDKVVAGDK